MLFSWPGAKGVVKIMARATIEGHKIVTPSSQWRPQKQANYYVYMKHDTHAIGLGDECTWSIDEYQVSSCYEYDL